MTPAVASYQDSAVVIAGGTSGIGLASAVGFLEAGVRRVALAARSVDRGTTVRNRLRESYPDALVEFLPVDALDAAQVTDVIGRAHELLGSIDVMVTSVASPYRPDLLHRLDPADFADILGTQALPPMHFTRAVMPIMSTQGGGSIVNVASDAAKVATPGESVLGAAMAAIVMFSRTAAMEGKRTGIRVNALTPSLVTGTPTTALVLEEGFSKKLFEKAAGLAHLGVADPEDLASLVVYLGGPASARLTGQAISVNGGISAG